MKVPDLFISYIMNNQALFRFLNMQFSLCCNIFIQTAVNPLASAMGI